MISPSVLREQRIAVAPVPETKCPGCGRRTRDKSGTCGSCQRLALRDTGRLPTEQIVKLISAAKAELEKRRNEIDAALRSEP